MRDHDFEAPPKAPRPGDRPFKHAGTREQDEAFGWRDTDPGVKADPESRDRRYAAC